MAERMKIVKAIIQNSACYQSSCQDSSVVGDSELREFDYDSIFSKNVMILKMANVVFTNF
jgi:hypothetical protein